MAVIHPFPAHTCLRVLCAAAAQNAPPAVPAPAWQQGHSAAIWQLSLLCCVRSFPVLLLDCSPLDFPSYYPLVSIPSPTHLSHHPPSLPTTLHSTQLLFPIALPMRAKTPPRHMDISVWCNTTSMNKGLRVAPIAGQCSACSLLATPPPLPCLLCAALAVLGLHAQGLVLTHNWLTNSCLLQIPALAGTNNAALPTTGAALCSSSKARLPPRDGTASSDRANCSSGTGDRGGELAPATLPAGHSRGAPQGCAYSADQHERM